MFWFSISSFLQYGLIAWGLAFNIYVKPVNILQKKLIRAISFEPHCSPSAPILFQ